MSDEDLRKDYEEKYNKLEFAVREMQEAWAKLHGNTPGSLVTNWSLATSASNINNDGNAVSQVMILGYGNGETLIGISKLSYLYWEQDVLKAFKWDDE